MSTRERVIYKKGQYRIIELPDHTLTWADAKGDRFNPKFNKDVSKKELKKQELAFEQFIDEHQAYGFMLEYWDPTIGQGWQHVDSCFGFIGKYNPKDSRFNHYIVKELKTLIPKKVKS
jgi:hypothetical protein